MWKKILRERKIAMLMMIINIIAMCENGFFFLLLHFSLIVLDEKAPAPQFTIYIYILRLDIRREMAANDGKSV